MGIAPAPSSFTKQLGIFSTVRRIPRHRVRFEYGFGFDHLYHPYIEALSTGSVASASTLLENYYERMHLYVMSLRGLWERWPVQAWGNSASELAEIVAARTTPTGQFTNFEGGFSAAAAYRSEKLFRLEESIRRDGFSWLTTFRTHPPYGLKVGDSVLIQGGQHRISVLGFTGASFFPISLRTRRNLAPRELSIATLPLVAKGFLEVEEAARILARIESGLTRESAVKMGFPIS
jgi:hypothetical protein